MSRLSANEETNSHALRLAIVKKDGETWPLSRKFLSSGHRSREKKIADQVNEFLEIDVSNS